MKRHAPPATASLAAALLTFATTGCHPAMSSQAGSRQQPPAPTVEVPLRFGGHAFQAHCYNVIGCHVLYADSDFSPNPGSPDRETLRSPPPPSPDHRETWGLASTIGIQNFPPPAEVKWTSLDGTEHSVQVDIGEIFKDELVWHNVPKTDMAHFFEGPYAGDPSIHLEVNDRTINVYMMMLVPTKSEQIAGNKNSHGRDDLFLVWTNTY